MEALSQCVTKEDMVESLRKLRHMYNCLEPLILEETTVDRIIMGLE
jgi:hypothetical protein